MLLSTGRYSRGINAVLNIRIGFSGNVRLHTDPLVFIHIFISVKISSASRDEFVGSF